MAASGDELISRERRSAEGDGKRTRTADGAVPFPVHRIGSQAQRGKSRAQARQRDLKLEAGERRPEAIVWPETETEVAVLLTVEIDDVGVRKLRRVVIRGGDPEPDGGAGGDLLPRELQLAGRAP